MRRDAGCGMRDAWGFTLVEVLVVLALVGLMAGISGLALASLDQPREADVVRQLGAARAEAIRIGRPVTVTTDAGDTVVYHPDGSARGPGVDPLTGAPHAEP